MDKINEKYVSFQKFYFETYPPDGVPTTTKAADMKQAIDIAYQLYLDSPYEYEEIINSLFDEFESALALMSLSGTDDMET